MSDVSDYEWDTAPLEMLEMGYEDYLNRLFEAMNDDDADMSTIAVTGMDFCGCDTCCTRETFAYLMPKFIDLHKQGYIRAKEELTT